MKSPSGRSAQEGDEDRPARRGAPPPGLQPAPKFLWIALAVVSVGVVVSFFYMLLNRPGATKAAPVRMNDPSKELEQVRRLYKQAEDAYNKGQAAVEDDVKRNYMKKAEEQLVQAAEKFDVAVESIVDPDGSLPPEYAGYEELRSNIQRLLIDVSKSSSLE